MPLNLEQKQAVVAEVAEVAANAFSVVAAEYRGLTVVEMTELRQQARESGVYLRVVKNTLVRKAVENTDFECIQDALSGPLIVAFSMEDPGCAARLVKTFSKDMRNWLELSMLSAFKSRLHRYYFFKQI